MSYLLVTRTGTNYIIIFSLNAKFVLFDEKKLYMYKALLYDILAILIYIYF